METKEILKQLRKKHGFQNAIDFCAKIGISYNTYQNYESGKRIPTADILMKLADFYNVTTDYLLGRNTEETETIDKLVSEFNMTILEKKILEGYLELPENMRGDFMKFLENAVIETQEESKL